MNPDSFPQRPYDELPMNLQYPATTRPSFSPSQQAACFDFPGRLSHQRLMSATPQPSGLLDNSCDFTTPMSLAPSQNSWATHTSISPSFDHRGNYNNYSSIMSGETREGFAPEYANVPRTWQVPYDPQMLNDGSTSMETYDSSPYEIDINKQVHQSSSPPVSGLLYPDQDNSRDFARLSISHSPKAETSSILHLDNSTLFRQTSNEPSEDGESTTRDMAALDTEDPGMDEPYAKLIYRALMSAPNKSMVLQEIYQWFRKNTNKGDSDSRGWMNSIRHNLSMNAAFRKTERKTTGDETKKSTEWVLEEFAIKDGVQSTTRYRKGPGSKKFIKSEKPDPSRQTSGRKGGISTGKIRLQRQRYRDDRDMRRPIQRIDTARLSNFVQQQQQHCQIPQHRLSPVTPPSLDMGEPAGFYFDVPKIEQFDAPLEYRLEDLQGVYDDGLPLFSSNHGLPLNTDPICSDQHY